MEQHLRESAIYAIQTVYLFNPGVKDMLQDSTTKTETTSHINYIRDEMKKNYVAKGVIKASIKLLNDKYKK